MEDDQMSDEVLDEREAIAALASIQLARDHAAAGRHGPATALLMQVIPPRTIRADSRLGDTRRRCNLYNSIPFEQRPIDVVQVCEGAKHLLDAATQSIVDIALAEPSGLAANGRKCVTLPSQGYLGTFAECLLCGRMRPNRLPTQ